MHILCSDCIRIFRINSFVENMIDCSFHLMNNISAFSAILIKVCFTYRLKRNTDDISSLDDGTKKPKLASVNAQGIPSQSPVQSQIYSQPETQHLSQSNCQNSSQSLSYTMSYNAQQPQAQTKRGPGRPKKVQGPQGSLCSPKPDNQSLFENGSILSPPSNDKRRKPSSNSISVKDEILASPPPVSNMKAAPTKQRRRQSKKDQNIPDHDMQSVTSPSAKNSSVALSPSPFLPSPARTPGSSSSVSFTHSRDLTVNISDLDKLFEASDDEDDLDNRHKVRFILI